MAELDVPTDLLRAPAGDLADRLDDPLERQARRRNRYRKPTVRIWNPNVEVEPDLSADDPPLQISRTRVTKAGNASAIGLANKKPNEGFPLAFAINSVRVFTGRVTSAEFDDSGRLRVQCFDDMRKLRRATFSGSYNDESLGVVVEDVCRTAQVTADVGGEYFLLDDVDLDPDAPGQQPIPTGYRGIIDEEGEDSQTDDTTYRSDREGSGDDTRTVETVTHDFEDWNCADALDTLASWADAEWFVDRFNILRFTPRPVVEDYSVNGILDSSAGGQELPFTKVVVVGGPKPNGKAGDAGGAGSAGQQERRRPRASKDLIRGVAGDKSAPKAQTFRTRRPAIQSQKVADAIARYALREQFRQGKQGTVTLSGRAVLHPYDTIRMPPYYGENEVYLVGGVDHTLDSDEGFRTVVNCGAPSPDRPARTRRKSTGQGSSAGVDTSAGGGDGDGPFGQSPGYIPGDDDEPPVPLGP